MIAIFLFAGGLLAQDQPSASQTPAAPVTILIARPFDASIAGNDGWFGALLESALHFKIGAVQQIALVPAETLYKHIPHYADRSHEIKEDRFRSLARQKNVSYILFQKFEIRKEREVQYLLEIVSAKSDRIVQSVEGVYPLESMERAVDTAVLSLQNLLKIDSPRETEYFLQTPVVSATAKSLKTLGTIIAGCAQDGSDPAECAAQYSKLLGKENALHLARYLGARASIAARQFDTGAMLLDQLLPITGPAYPAMYLRAADSFRRCRRLDDALRVIQQGERQNLTSPALLLIKAQIYADHGIRSKAREVYAQVLQQNPNQLDALLFLARAAVNDSIPDSVSIYANRIMAIQPGNGDALAYKGWVAMNAGDYAGAQEILQRAIAAAPANDFPVLQLGNCHFRAGAYEKAFRMYRKACQKYPDDPQIALQTAITANLIGDRATARTLARKIDNANQADPVFQRRIGLLKYALQDTVTAIVHLESALAGGQQDGEVLLALANLYLQVKRNDDAFAKYQEGLTAAGDKNAFRVGIIRYFLLQNDSQQALSYAQDILAENPVYPDVNRYLSEIYLRTGDNAKALACVQKQRAETGDTPDLQRTTARLLYSLGRKKEAAADYLLLAKAGRGDAETYFRLAESSLDKDNMTDADACMRKGLSLGKPDENLLMLWGRKYADHKMYARSIESLRRYMAVSPYREDALKLLAAMQAALEKDPSAATRFYHGYLRSHPGDTWALLSLGRLYTAGRMYQKGIEILKQATDADKSCASCFEMSGDLYAARRNTAQATTSYNRALAVSGNDDTIFVKLGNVIQLEGKYDKARQFYEKALSANAQNEQARYRAAHLYIKDGSAADAEKIAQTYPATAKTGWYYLLAGEMHEAKKAWSPALTAYLSALRTLPDEPTALAGCGRSYLALQDFSNAKLYLEKAAAIMPDDPDVLISLGRACAGRKDYSRALTLYRRAAKFDGKNPDIYSALAAIEIKRGSRTKAIEDLEKALKYGPRSSRLSLLLANQYRRASKFDKAIGAFKQAARDGTDQEQIEAYRSIATIYYVSLKQRDKAKEFYRKYVEAGGKDPVLVRRAK